MPTEPSSHRSFLFLLLLLCLAFSGCSGKSGESQETATILPETDSSLGTTTPSTVAGLYGLGSVDKPMGSALLDNTHLVGVSLRFSWAALEPESGRLDTILLDTEIQRAKDAGKKIQLRVIPGARTPDWVYLLGVPAVHYMDYDPSTGLPTGEWLTVPVPWDTKYLSAWTSFIERLGQHLGDDASIVLVHMTGANARSGEFHLTSGALSTDTTAQYLNGQGQIIATGTVDDLWLQYAGYSLDNIRMAWAVSSDAWADAFPSPKLTYDIVGQVHKQDNIRNEVNLIVEDAYAAWPDRLTLQNNGHHDDASLDGKRSSNTYQIIQTYSLNLDTGFQSLEAHGNCSGTENTGDLGPALAVGAYLYGADYFELYLKEIEKYPEVVQECNDFLRGQGGSCGGAGPLLCALDTEVPTVLISSPQAGETISGGVTVEVEANDNILIFGVGLSVDGSPAGPEQIVSVPASPIFHLPWDTASVSPGLHTLTVTARDVSGNTSETSIKVTSGP